VFTPERARIDEFTHRLFVSPTQSRIESRRRRRPRTRARHRIRRRRRERPSILGRFSRHVRQAHAIRYVRVHFKRNSELVSITVRRRDALQRRFIQIDVIPNRRRRVRRRSISLAPRSPSRGRHRILALSRRAAGVVDARGRRVRAKIRARIFGGASRASMATRSRRARARRRAHVSTMRSRRGCVRVVGRRVASRGGVAPTLGIILILILIQVPGGEKNEKASGRMKR